MAHKYDKYNKKGLIKRTMPYIMQNKAKILICIISAILIAILVTITPRITKSILDDYISPSINGEITRDVAISKIKLLLIYYGVLTLIVVVLRYAQNYVLNLVGMNIERSIREDAIRKIDYLQVDYYSLEPDGKIVSKITADSTGVRTYFNVFFSIGQALINLVCVYIGMILLQWQLAIIILIIVPIILVWITFYRKRVHNYYTELRETSSRITGKLNELISGTLVIQAFNQEEYMLDDYKELVTSYNNQDKKVNTISIYFGWELLIFIKRLVEAGILIYFGYEYFKIGGVIVTAGLITTFTNYLDRIISPINTIFNNLNELEDSMVAANRVYMFLDEPNDTRIFDGKTPPEEIEGHVEFKNVHFSYVQNHEVLHGINLDVKPGQTIGIVGHTGSGKSSLMNLLLQYNDTDSGEILLDGQNIEEYNKTLYRHHCGIVLQTPALFEGTLKSNVTLGSNHTDEEVIEVLREVGAGYLIDKNEEGINAHVSFKGENMSLGEKQLVSFARILLRNPKILVLDEATANIDTATEMQIKHAMNVVTKGRTTFIIAHRLSTIKDADKIVVLDAGLIKGEGTHTELYQNCPIYKDMYDSQYEMLKYLKHS